MVGKKKRGHPDIEEVLARPWCYYCERDFDDLKILISHQKAKHFKCERCGRRLNTAGGLSVHMNQVHKETLTTVENALGNRAGLEIEIFGMEGIPTDVVQAHNQRIIAAFYQAEAERRAQTGNNPSGASGQGVAKRPKFESPAELKKRLAEHKAKLAEKAAGGGSEHEDSPSLVASPAVGQSPALIDQAQFNVPPTAYAQPQGASYGAYSQDSYVQPPPAYPQPYNPQAAYPPPQQAMPGQYPPQQFPPQQFPPQQFPPPQQYPQQGYQQPPPFQGGPPMPYGGQPQHFQALPAHSPPPLSMLPNRPPSLPQAPGLPQRPSFSGAPGSAASHFNNHGPPQNGGWNQNGHGWSGSPQPIPAMSSGFPNASNHPPAGDDIDELIRMAEAGIRPPNKSKPEAPTINNPLPAAPAPAPVVGDIVASTSADTKPSNIEPVAPVETNDKKSKKDKDKNNKMVYSDNDVSPEEKMAKMSRYAFVPAENEEKVTVNTTATTDVVDNANE